MAFRRGRTWLTFRRCACARGKRAQTIRAARWHRRPALPSADPVRCCLVGRCRQGVLSVRLAAPTGGTRWAPRFPVPVAKIPGSVRASLIDVAADRARPQIEAARRRGRGMPGSTGDLVTRGLSLPGTMLRRVALSSVRTVQCGSNDCQVWLEDPGFVLDPAGSPLFQLEVPRGFGWEEASMQWLWRVATDEMGSRT